MHHACIGGIYGLHTCSPTSREHAGTGRIAMGGLPLRLDGGMPLTEEGDATLACGAEESWQMKGAGRCLPCATHVHPVCTWYLLCIVLYSTTMCIQYIPTGERRE